MKPEDFLMALNDADDAYVKKAGIKGGYFTLYQETGNSNTEAQGIPTNLHQETARQRSFKRFCIAAAACLAVAALSWGTLALLRQSPMWGKNSPAGTNPTDGIAPSDAETTQPTEAASETVESAKTIWVGAWEASCVAGEDAYHAVVNTVRKDPNLKAAYSWQTELVPMDEGEQAQLLEQAGTGKLSLQNGLGPEIAALAASEPEHVSVVCLRWVVFGSVTDTADIMAQTFFTVQSEDGSWRIVDATDRQNADFMNISELDATQLQALYGVYLDDESLTYTPGADAIETLNSLKHAVHDLHPEVNLAVTWGGAYGGSEKDIELQLEGFRTMQLQRGRNAEILEMLEAGAEEIEVIHFNFTFWNDNVEDASPSNRFSLQQLFFLSKNEDGLWEILDASYPRAAGVQTADGQTPEEPRIMVGNVELEIPSDGRALSVVEELLSAALTGSVRANVWTSQLDTEAKKQDLLDRVCSGRMELQNGRAQALQELYARDPGFLWIVSAEIRVKQAPAETGIPDGTQGMYFFLSCDAGNSYRILDATYPEALPQDDSFPAGIGFLLGDDAIPWTPSTNPNDVFTEIFTTLSENNKLCGSAELYVGNSNDGTESRLLQSLDLSDSGPLQTKSGEKIRYLLENELQNIVVGHLEYTVMLPDQDYYERGVTVNQYIFLTRGEDGLWYVFDATFPDHNPMS